MDVDVLQVVLAAPWMISSPPTRATPLGTGIDARPLRYWPVIDSLTFLMPGTGPL